MLDLKSDDGEVRYGVDPATVSMVHRPASSVEPPLVPASCKDDKDEAVQALEAFDDEVVPALEAADVSSARVELVGEPLTKVQQRGRPDEQLAGDIDHVEDSKPVEGPESTR